MKILIRKEEDKMKNLAYDLALIYAKTKFEEYCRRKEDSEMFGDSSVLLESLDDFFEEAYKHYTSIENFNDIVND